MKQEKTELVWHYTDGAALMNILARDELWASSAAFMNDMNELLSGSIQLRKHFEDQRSELALDVIDGLEEYIPEVQARAGQYFVLSASSDGDSLTMWRYYGREQVSFAIGLDRNEPLVPLARLKSDSHPNPPEGYYDDIYLRDHDGKIATFPDGRSIIVEDPDQVLIEGGKWKRVIYDTEQQAEIIADVFQKLYQGVERFNQLENDGRPKVWLFPYVMNESLDLIKNTGFRDEREERITVWPIPDWKFVFHRPGPFGLVPYVKLTSLNKENRAENGDPYATKPGQLPIREIRLGPTPYGPVLL